MMANRHGHVDDNVDPLPPRPSASKSSSRTATRKQHDERSTDTLLVKRLVDLEYYRSDARAGKYDKLSTDEIRRQFGSDMLPIFVPLARGESMRQYEERFIDWLWRERHPSVRDMDRDGNRQLERRLRIKFADLNANGVERFESKGEEKVRDHRKRQYDSSSDRDHRKRERSSRDRSASDESTTAEPISKRLPPEDRLRDSADDKGTCHVKLPSSPSDVTTAELVAAYVACACRACLMNAVTRMATRVSELEKRFQGSCPGKAKQTDTRVHVADITRDDDRQSPGETSVNNEQHPSAAAIKDLVLSRSSIDDSSRRTAATSRPKTCETDDPVEQQLAAAYDVLNKRIAANEKTLSVSSTRLADASLTDIDKLAQLHDEKDALAVAIERDVENRVVALAALAVYVWRQDRTELERMVNDTAASNVPYLQTVSHRKGANISREITQKRLQAAEIRRQLDTAMQREEKESESETERLVELQRLGELLTKTECEMYELRAQRRRELATLIHFDLRVRGKIQQQLQAP